MKTILTLLFTLLSFVKAADIPWQTGERVVFIGDSITDAKKWSHYVSSYLALRFPEKLLWIQQRGRGGSTMSQWMDSGNANYEEYHKCATPLNADRVIAMFGHNGSLSSSAWQADYESLIANYIIAEGASPILVGPHPQTTSTGATKLGGTFAQPSPDGYSTRLKNIASAGSYLFCDTWNTLWPIFTNPANWTAIQFPGTQTAPTTHPGTAGHVMIAYTVIKQLGWGDNVSNAEIDASTATLTAATDCAITNVAANGQGGVNFTRLDARLPWSIDEDGRASAAAMLPELVGWQKYTLKVTGLAAGNYTVTANGVTLATLSAETLANGWNMADLTTGPAWQAGQEVLGRFRDLAGVNRTTLVKKSPNDGMIRYTSNAAAYYTTHGLRGEAYLTAMQPAIVRLNELTTAIHAAATPQPISFSITAAP